MLHKTQLASKRDFQLHILYPAYSLPPKNFRWKGEKKLWKKKWLFLSTFSHISMSFYDMEVLYSSFESHDIIFLRKIKTYHHLLFFVAVTTKIWSVKAKNKVFLLWLLTKIGDAFISNNLVSSNRFQKKDLIILDILSYKSLK